MEKTILNPENPVTQSIDSVRALLAYLHRPADPLPSFVELQNHVRLTLSKDKKAYYLTTTKDCSCPARAFNPGAPCKHMKALELSLEDDDPYSHPRRLARPPDDLLPERAQPFRPVSDDKIPRLETRPGAVVA